MKKLIATLGFAATLALPFAAAAQTTTTTTSTASYQYEYVDTSGQIRSIMAPDATTALDTAPNLALHSGVIYIANSSQALPNASVSL